MDRTQAMSMFRVREALDKIGKDDVSLPVYKTLEAIYAWIELSVATQATQPVAMRIEDLMAAAGASDSKKTAPADGKLENPKSGQYL